MLQRARCEHVGGIFIEDERVFKVNRYPNPNLVRITRARCSIPYHRGIFFYYEKRLPQRQQSCSRLIVLYTTSFSKMKYTVSTTRRPRAMAGRHNRCRSPIPPIRVAAPASHFGGQLASSRHHHHRSLRLSNLTGAKTLICRSWSHNNSSSHPRAHPPPYAWQSSSPCTDDA